MSKTELEKMTRDKTLLKKADGIFEYVNSNDPLEERIKCFRELFLFFRDFDKREIKVLLRRNLERTWLIAGKRGESSILIIFSGLLKGFSRNELNDIGLDEETVFRQYLVGIKAWGAYPQVREGIVELFTYPHQGDLSTTISYLDEQVRRRHPEFSKDIDSILSYIKQHYKYRE